MNQPEGENYTKLFFYPVFSPALCCSSRSTLTNYSHFYHDLIVNSRDYQWSCSLTSPRCCARNPNTKKYIMKRISYLHNRYKKQFFPYMQPTYIYVYIYIT